MRDIIVIVMIILMFGLVLCFSQNTQKKDNCQLFSENYAAMHSTILDSKAQFDHELEKGILLCERP